MNLLHVLSGDFVTGSETSTAALVQAQTARGHKVLIASGKFSHPVKAKHISLPIYDRGMAGRLRNIRGLMRIIRAEKIDLVHAHSRAASWVCYWACRFTRTAFVSTLHGRQHIHFSNRHFNIYGPDCAVVCENIQEQMLEETKVFQPEQLTVIRNGLLL